MFRYNSFQNLVTGLFLALFLFTIFIFEVREGTITIELPYYNELNQCENDLLYCSESKTPDCSPCVQTKDKGYWAYYIFAVIIYLGSFFLASNKSKKLDQREKELNEAFNKLMIRKELKPRNFKKRKGKKRT